MSQWIEIIGAFLGKHWIAILVTMILLYYVYHYLMLVVSIAIFPVVAIGSGLWSLNRHIRWPEDEDSTLSARNFFFFLAGLLAFIIEIWLFRFFSSTICWEKQSFLYLETPVYECRLCRELDLEC